MNRIQNYCDDCIHFIPDEEGEDKAINELCEFEKPLKFKMPPKDNWTSYDYGFYLPGCKDFKEKHT